jgi:hypothetical protein
LVPVVLFVILGRILLVGINVPLLLLAALASLSGLLLSLAVLALPRLTALFAVLTTLLLVLFHIVCHEYSSNVAEHVLPRFCGIIGTGKLVAVASEKVDAFLFAVVAPAHSFAVRFSISRVLNRTQICDGLRYAMGVAP